VADPITAESKSIVLCSESSSVSLWEARWGQRRKTTSVIRGTGGDLENILQSKLESTIL